MRAALDGDGAIHWRSLRCVDCARAEQDNGYARAEQDNGGEDRPFDCFIHIHILGLPSFCSRSNFLISNCSLFPKAQRAVVLPEIDSVLEQYRRLSISALCIPKFSANAFDSRQ
jgi:hypothetical protein